MEVEYLYSSNMNIEHRYRGSRIEDACCGKKRNVTVTLGLSGLWVGGGSFLFFVYLSDERQRLATFFMPTTSISSDIRASNLDII